MGVAVPLSDELIECLSPEEAYRLEQSLRYRWSLWARPNQLPPGDDWDVWGLVGGRGSGKTRPGAEWTIEKARKHPGCRIALVARTAADCRDTMVLGESGILACSPPWFRPRYVPSKRLLIWPNGSEAHMYSAEKPDLLRGPQFHFAWGDEFAAWKRVKDEKGGDAWSNLQDALRLGRRPQTLLTTTPRPTEIVLDTFLGARDEKTGKRPVSSEETAKMQWSVEISTGDQMGRPVTHRTVVQRFRTEENQVNLSVGYAAKRRAKYAGTRLGAQELDAEFLLANDAALWTQEIIDLERLEEVDSPPVRRVVAVDPTRSELRPRDECGIVVGCLSKNGHAYVLEDGTLRGSPFEWGTRAISLARKYSADAIVYEQSGLDKSTYDTLRTVAAYEDYRWVPRTAREKKKARAEPVSALYKAGRVHHVNKRGETFEFLEDEMISWDPNSKISPNRLDALVWLLTDLLLTGAEPAPIVAPGSITGEGWRP